MGEEEKDDDNEEKDKDENGDDEENEDEDEEKTSGFSSRAALSAATVASAKVRFTALLSTI